MTASSRTSSAAAWPCSTAMPTAGRTCTSPAAPSPRRCTATRARSAARWPSTPVPSATPTSTRSTGAYPLDVDGDGLVDLAVLRVGENVLLRGHRRLRLRARERAMGLRWRRRLDHRLQRDVGGRVDACRRSPSATISCSTTRTSRRATTTATTTRSSARGRRRRTRRRSRSARLVHAVAAVQRLGPIRPPRPARLERPPLLRRRARSSCGGSSPARPRELWTREEGWQPLRIWGMGIASHDLTGDGYPEVYLTSQADNKLQTLADGADPTGVRATSRSSAARPRTSRTPATSRCARPHGTPSSRT